MFHIETYEEWKKSMNAAKGAAFFDLDGTITRINTDYCWFQEGFRAGRYGYWFKIRGTWLTVLWMLGLKAAADVKIGVAEEAFRGRREDETLELARELYRIKLHGEIYKQATAAIEELRSQGLDLYIVSTSFYMSVVPFFEGLGFDGYFATMPEVDEAGVYSGRLVPPIHSAEQKALTIKELAQTRGYDLELCHAFGDSYDDRFMLDAVGYPNAVNPHKRLRRVAEKNGWPVREWRETIA